MEFSFFLESNELPSHNEVIEVLTNALFGKIQSPETLEKETMQVPSKLTKAIMNNLYARGLLSKLSNNRFKLNGGAGTIKGLIKQSLVDVNYPDK